MMTPLVADIAPVVEVPEMEIVPLADKLVNTAFWPVILV
jgi:hypothetical protein